jgi:hypothetical protein
MTMQLRVPAGNGNVTDWAATSAVVGAQGLAKCTLVEA